MCAVMRPFLLCRAVHGPPPVLYAVPPGGQMVPVQPGHGKEYTAIDMAQVEHTLNS